MRIKFEASKAAIAICSVATLWAATPAAAQVYTVTAGTTDTTQKDLDTDDQLWVESTGQLTPPTNPAVVLNGPSTDLRIYNFGYITTTSPTGRAIDTAGAAGTRNIYIGNYAGSAIIAGNDAIRVNVNPAGGLIVVDNFGRIESTGTGQAIDFDAISGPGATVQINNYTGGLILSNQQDAIRPGEGAYVFNNGIIYATGAANQTFDGIDWQANSGIVFNDINGQISGQRHGITADNNVYVINYGSIQGRNGSGVGSDGTGYVLNYGNISGQWDGVSANGDGDGVDIDGIGVIFNYGVIAGFSAAGVDGGGQPNNAQGIAMGGGYIQNGLGGFVLGGSTGILIDNGSGGAAFGATTIENEGTIQGGTGAGIVLVGGYDDTINAFATSKIIGGNGIALDMGDGNDLLNIRAGATFTGAILGGLNHDQIALYGPGNGVLSTTQGFELLQVFSGNWSLTGSHQFTVLNVGSGLTLTSLDGALTTGTVNLLGNSQLVFNQNLGSTFGGTIALSGSVTKTGSGTLTFTGAQTYTGATTVTGGTLVLGGSLASTVFTVGAGATLTSALATTIGTAGPSFSVTNAGTIGNTAAGNRAIDITGAAGARTISISNAAGATIQSGNDAIRINANVTGGSVTVDNWGLIRSLNGGQAIDFDAIASTGATITINNYASGQIRSIGQDAIRPGQGATVNNYGLIFSDGAPNNSYDGVDWQARSGTVNNFAGATISGLRHGITSDTAVTVYNEGLIFGRNGSGVGSDGTGTVTNYGTIRGRWDGAAINGDGDGVDIDLLATIYNFGTIEGLSAVGVDSGGRPNSAQGVAVGGGTVWNYAGATIFGAAQGILVNLDTNPGGAAVGATWVANAGTITGATGAGIQFVGNFDDLIETNGVISGGNGTALDMGGGNDRLDVYGGATFVGVADGGAGTGDVVNLASLSGTGNFTMTGTVNFETLNIVSGNWTLTGSHLYSGGGIVIGNGLSVTTTSQSVTGSNIANGGVLTFAQSTSGTYAGTISGAGNLVKTGAGNLTLAGAQTYTGSTTVSAGTLTLGGTMAGGSYSIASGATLTGTGTTTLNSSAAAIVIINSGTLSNTNAAGRAVDITGAGSRTVAIQNNAGATISGAAGSIRLNDIGSLTLVNAGAISGAIALTGTYADAIGNTGTITGAGTTVSTGAGNDTVTNTGAISGGSTGLDTGDGDDVVNHSGTISGSTTAVNLGAGNDTLNLGTGMTLTGAVDGGAGTDGIFLLLGTGTTGTFNGSTNVETLRVAGGNWTITGSSTYSGGITINAGTTLNGDTNSLNGAIQNNGALVFNQSTTGTYSGTLTGSGSLTKLGTGTVNFGANSGFNGATLISAGRVNFNGAMPTAVTVANGATAGGTGTIASLVVQSGGTVAPGTSPGTLTITGNFTQSTGSFYAAEIAPGGVGDRITVGGTATIQTGTTLNITRDAGTYTAGTTYVLLSATGGITGAYTTVNQVVSGGIELRLAQTATQLSVTTARTAASLAGTAGTINQQAVAPAFATLGVGNAAYAALTLLPNDADVRSGLQQMAGEIHASARTALIYDAMAAQRAVLAQQPGEGAALWIQGSYGTATDEGAPNYGVSETNRDTWSVVGGLTYGIAGGTSFGIAGGYSNQKLDTATGQASADIDTGHLLAHVAAQAGIGRFRVGGGYGWSKVETARSVVFPGFSAGLGDRYDANVLHGYAEAGAAVPAFKSGTVEPFVGYAAYRVSSGPITEFGSSVALRAGETKETFELIRAGVKLDAPISATVAFRGSAAWNHVLGDAKPDVRFAFANGSAFSVTGTVLSDDAATVDAALVWQASPRTRVSIGYNGEHGSRVEDHAGKLQVSFGF